MHQKTLVMNMDTEAIAVFDSPDQVNDYVCRSLGIPEGQIIPIPKEFQVMCVPYYAAECVA